MNPSLLQATVVLLDNCQPVFTTSKFDLSFCQDRKCGRATKGCQHFISTIIESLFMELGVPRYTSVTIRLNANLCRD